MVVENMQTPYRKTRNTSHVIAFRRKVCFQSQGRDPDNHINEKCKWKNSLKSSEGGLWGHRYIPIQYIPIGLSKEETNSCQMHFIQMSYVGENCSLRFYLRSQRLQCSKVSTWGHQSLFNYHCVLIKKKMSEGLFIFYKWKQIAILIAGKILSRCWLLYLWKPLHIAWLKKTIVFNYILMHLICTVYATV